MRASMPSGFTLVELLAVLTLLGVLATLAISRLGGASERAQTAVVAADLRNLTIQQESYRTSTGSYAQSLTQLPDLGVSGGVILTITLADGGRGWAAVARHVRMPRRRCGIFFGDGSAGVGGPATVAGVVTCGDMPQDAPAPGEPDGDLPGGEAPTVIQEPGAPAPPPPS